VLIEDRERKRERGEMGLPKKRGQRDPHDSNMTPHLIQES